MSDVSLVGMTDRCKIADLLVGFMLTQCRARCPAMSVHWDDCDSDERRFWFMFRAPQLGQVGVSRSPQMLDASAAIRLAMRASEVVLKTSDCYDFYWKLWRRPTAICASVCRRRHFTGYDTDTWTYVLAICG